MSLDVYLNSPTPRMVKCPTCGFEHPEFEELYSANITHNLGKMADEAGIYQPLWRPEEIGAVTAHDIIGKLGVGLSVLKSDPEHFKKFNAENGWGLYEHFVLFVENYLNACIEYPDAIIHVSR